MTLSRIAAIAVAAFFLPAAPLRAAEPSLTFSPAAASANSGDRFSVDVYVDTAGAGAGGTGAIIIFDPVKLRAEDINPGDIFADYPTVIIDNDAGRLAISGIAASPQDLFNGAGVFARIDFSALTVGESTVKFDFRPGSTTDSNIAVMTEPGDILTRVNELKVTVNPGSGQGGGYADDSYAAATPEETNKENLLGQVLQTINANLPWTEPAVTRAGRPESAKLTAEGPLPRQEPITDPNQSQPVKQTDIATNEEKKSALNSVLSSPEFIAAAAISGTLGLGFLLFKLWF